MAIAEGAIWCGSGGCRHVKSAPPSRTFPGSVPCGWGGGGRMGGALGRRLPAWRKFSGAPRTKQPRCTRGRAGAGPVIARSRFSRALKYPRASAALPLLESVGNGRHTNRRIAGCRRGPAVATVPRPVGSVPARLSLAPLAGSAMRRVQARRLRELPHRKAEHAPVLPRPSRRGAHRPGCY